MEIGKTYCTRCNQEVNQVFCPTCDPKIILKKYTLAEIRAMFEKSYEYLYLRRSRDNMSYIDDYTEQKYKAYEQAFEDLGLLEE